MAASMSVICLDEMFDPVSHEVFDAEAGLPGMYWSENE